MLLLPERYMRTASAEFGNSATVQRERDVTHVLHEGFREILTGVDQFTDAIDERVARLAELPLARDRLSLAVSQNETLLNVGEQKIVF
jgi:ATP phosphoribosyltransferase